MTTFCEIFLGEFEEVQKEQRTLASGSGSFADSLLIPVNGKLQAESCRDHYADCTLAESHMPSCC